MFDIHVSVHRNIGCPTTYKTRHFFNNSKTNKDIATKQTHTTDTFLFISHTMNVLMFKFRCNIFIDVRIIKEMPGLVGSGTPCIIPSYSQKDATFLKLFISKDSLHVSGCSSVHHQEHTTVQTCLLARR
jgi:hypothetical protein